MVQTPHSTAEFSISLFVGFSILAICLAKFHLLTGARNATGLVSIFSGAIVLFGVAITIASVLTYAYPNIEDPGKQKMLLILGPTAVFLLPLLGINLSLFRAGYIGSLISWFGAVCIASMAIFVVSLCFPDKKGGQKVTFDQIIKYGKEVTEKVSDGVKEKAPAVKEKISELPGEMQEGLDKIQKDQAEENQ